MQAPLFSAEFRPLLRPISLNAHAGTSASRAPHRLWPKPVRVRVSSRLKQNHPPRRCAWRRLCAQPQVR